MLRNIVLTRRLALVAILALALAALWVSLAVASAQGDSAARAQVTDLVFASLGSEGDLQLNADDAGLAARFTGAALEQEHAQTAHVQDLVRQGTDYPGPLHLSAERVLSITGSGTTYTVEVQFHAVRDNMRQGALVDQSTSDVIWDVTVIKTGAGWRISAMTGRFAPGGGP